MKRYGDKKNHLPQNLMKLLNDHAHFHVPQKQDEKSVKTEIFHFKMPSKAKTDRKT